MPACTIPNESLNKFLPRNWLAVFAIKEYGSGVSAFISTWTIYCDGLTDGVAFVVVRNMSKIKWMIMNAFQFSTMQTIEDAFPVVRSKVAIECAQ